MYQGTCERSRPIQFPQLAGSVALTLAAFYCWNTVSDILQLLDSASLTTCIFDRYFGAKVAWLSRIARKSAYKLKPVALGAFTMRRLSIDTINRQCRQFMFPLLTSVNFAVSIVNFCWIPLASFSWRKQNIRRSKIQNSRERLFDPALKLSYPIDCSLLTSW